jgi:hypothetical protein
MMTDEQLRLLVRDAVLRHLGLPSPSRLVAGGGHHADHHHAAHQQPAPEPHAHPPAGVTINVTLHPSHARYASLQRTDDADGNAGPCVIEPAVQCNHCGYCQSHGH